MSLVSRIVSDGGKVDRRRLLRMLVADLASNQVQSPTH